MHRPALASSFALLALTLGTLSAQSPSLPSMPAMNASPQMRFVDFSQDLDRPGAIVAIGRLGKGKEGKRERLADGKLGGAGSTSQVSGTQYFKVQVTAPIRVQKALFGKPEKLVVAFDEQIARLPDGKEQRQSMTGNAAALDDDELALWVTAPRVKGKGIELLHLIPFDKNIDKGKDPEAQFGDTMADFFTVNLRKHDLAAALDALDKAADAEAKKKALQAVRDLLDHKPELHQSENDALLTQHVGPLEARARKRLDEAAAEAGKEKGGEGKQ